ncbi:MAG: MFS transporter [Candidatus Nanoarchaeia archaeon]|jgi:MFS family permease
MRNNLNNFFVERVKHFKHMASLSNTFFFYLFAWGLVTPIFNIHINEVTNSLFLSGIIFSVFGFARIFFDPSIGLLCDRVNPKRLLQGSLLSYTLIFFLYTIANNFYLLLIVRVLHAIACAMLWISGWTLVRLKSKGNSAQEEISVWYSVQYIAYVIAPLIGGSLITMFSWQPVYYLASITAFIAFVYASINVKSVHTSNNSKKRFRDLWHQFFINKSSSIRLVLLTFLEILIVIGFYEFMPLLLDQAGLNIEEISVVFALAYTTPFILFPVIIGVISDKYGRKIPTAIGLIIISFGLLLFCNASTFTQFLFYTFIIVTGDAFVNLSFNAELNDMTPKNSAGGFTGIFEMIKDLAVAIGPLLVGVLSAVTNISFAFIIMSVMSLGTILVLKGFKNF